MVIWFDDEISKIFSFTTTDTSDLEKAEISTHTTCTRDEETGTFWLQNLEKNATTETQSKAMGDLQIVNEKHYGNALLILAQRKALSESTCVKMVRFHHSYVYQF